MRGVDWRRSTYLVGTIFEAIGLVLGSLLVAGLGCWLASRLAIRLHHQRWAALLMLLLLAAIALSGLTHSGFVKLSVVYGLLGAAILWFSTRVHEPRTSLLERDDK